LNVQLQEVPEWLCCGASSAHALDHTAGLCLAADTLAKARRAGLDQVLAPCAMCYQRLATAAHELVDTPGLAKRVGAALGEAADLDLTAVRPLNLLQWLEPLAADGLKSAVTHPLKGLKVACYYGCLLVRPPKITGATNAETPRNMEKIVEALGATTVRWSMALECCGGSFALSHKDAVLRQCRRIYDAAKQAGADLIALACPMCHANLDVRQPEYAGGEPAIPVVYLPQLIGVALGLSPADLAFKGHFVAVEPALDRALAKA
jgi:heterodisulfide reductase subunit B